MDDSIFIRGGRVHNLKNISLAIPHDRLTVVRGDAFEPAKLASVVAGHDVLVSAMAPKI